MRANSERHEPLSPASLSTWLRRSVNAFEFLRLQPTRKPTHLYHPIAPRVFIAADHDALRPRVLCSQRVFEQRLPLRLEARHDLARVHAELALALSPAKSRIGL